MIPVLQFVPTVELVVTVHCVVTSRQVVLVVTFNTQWVVLYLFFSLLKPVIFAKNTLKQLELT